MTYSNQWDDSEFLTETDKFQYLFPDKKTFLGAFLNDDGRFYQYSLTITENNHRKYIKFDLLKLDLPQVDNSRLIVAQTTNGENVPYSFGCEVIASFDFFNFIQELNSTCSARNWTGKKIWNRVYNWVGKSPERRAWDKLTRNKLKNLNSELSRLLDKFGESQEKIPCYIELLKNLLELRKDLRMSEDYKFYINFSVNVNSWKPNDDNCLDDSSKKFYKKNEDFFNAFYKTISEQDFSEKLAINKEIDLVKKFVFIIGLFSLQYREEQLISLDKKLFDNGNNDDPTLADFISDYKYLDPINSSLDQCELYEIEQDLLPNIQTEFLNCHWNDTPIQEKLESQLTQKLRQDYQYRQDQSNSGRIQYSPQNYIVAFYLSYQQNMSQQDIATQLNMLDSEGKSSRVQNMMKLKVFLNTNEEEMIGNLLENFHDWLIEKQPKWIVNSFVFPSIDKFFCFLKFLSENERLNWWNNFGKLKFKNRVITLKFEKKFENLPIKSIKFWIFLISFRLSLLSFFKQYLDEFEKLFLLLEEPLSKICSVWQEDRQEINDSSSHRLNNSILKSLQFSILCFFRGFKNPNLWLLCDWLCWFRIFPKRYVTLVAETIINILENEPNFRNILQQYKLI